MFIRTNRVGPGGILIFPHKGDPPGPIQGYIRDKGDPFVFKPILRECCYRSSTSEKVCGGMRLTMCCSHYQTKVKMVDCLDCTIGGLK